MDYSKHAGFEERASLWEVGAAVREVLYGNVAEARQRAEAALKLSQSGEVEFRAAFALARSGKMAQAEGLADDIVKRFPEDTSARFMYVPTLKAVFALERSDAAKAIEELQIATPYELGQARFFVGTMYPVYVRGEAFLAEGRGTEAAAEFQKILEHRGVVVSDPVGALARLQLARAYRMAGDKMRAKAAYEDFLSLWKNADADVAVLVEAKHEESEL